MYLDVNFGYIQYILIANSIPIFYEEIYATHS